MACKKQKALNRKHKTRKVVNAIQNDNDVLCSTWDSICFVLLANTCPAAAAHQYWASELHYQGMHHLMCHCDVSSAVAMHRQQWLYTRAKVHLLGKILKDTERYICWFSNSSRLFCIFTFRSEGINRCTSTRPNSAHRFQGKCPGSWPMILSYSTLDNWNIHLPTA